MPKKEKRILGNKKRRSDSDGVTVKRSYYSFSKYYPGGGSSQKYRKVMKETPDEKRAIKTAFAVIGLILVIFIGYFVTTVAFNISYAPTTEPTCEITTVTEGNNALPSLSENETASQNQTTQKPSETKIIEEPEREVNVTSQQGEDEGSADDISEIFTGY